MIFIIAIYDSFCFNYHFIPHASYTAMDVALTGLQNKYPIYKQVDYNRNTGAKIKYGDLVADAKKLKAPENPILKDPKDFTIIGKSFPRRDIPLKVNGEAKFGIDIKVPGMLYASIERSPVILGKLVRFNDEKAKAVKGVKYVLKTRREVFGQEKMLYTFSNYWD